MSTATLESATSAVDPVQLEIVNNALGSAADEMALMVMRSAYSPIVRDSMDYSTAIFDRFGQTIAQGLSLPVHLGAFPDVMDRLVERFGATLREGDLYLVNDPYGSGGMHLPDIYMVQPVFRDGTLEAFAAAIVHHADIGGMAPGSMALHATDIFQEGLRIPTLKLHEAGRPNEAVLALLEANSRMPIQLRGDLRAQMAACATGARRVQELLDKYGAAGFRGHAAALHDYGDRVVRGEIARMPDGDYRASDFIDGLGESGEPIHFQVRVTVAGDRIAIDWDGTSKQVKGAINCPIATTRSTAYMAVRSAVAAVAPNCTGATRAISIHAPEGTIVNPLAPAACAARGILAYRMVDVLLQAFAQIVPDRIPATGEGGPSAISLSGRKGTGHWLVTDGVLGSWGGRSARDGMEGVANPACNMSNQPVELIEARLPLRIERYGFVPNSGGPGRHRGGLAMERTYRVLADDADLTLRSDRRRFLTPGLDGGLPGTPSVNQLSNGSDSRFLPVMPMQTVPLRRGDRVRHIAPGAGGHGDPLERDPAAVLDDVLDDRIDRAYARSVYGVVAADDRVEADATAALRRTLRAEGRAADPVYLEHFYRAAGIDGAALRPSPATSDGALAARLLRPSWAEVDYGAIAHNIAVTRRLMPPDAKLYFVCKCDGYGFGVTRVAQLAAAAGADGLCVGSPEEAEALHAAGNRLPVLLFGCALPSDLARIAGWGVRLTVHSADTLTAVLGLARPVEVHVEIDCGLARFGLQPPQWRDAFAQLRAAPNIRVVGLYSHLSSPDDRAVSAAQAARFRDALAVAAECGLEGLEVMLASSRVTTDYPELCFSAIDPGRLIYGAMDAARMASHGLRPMLRAIKGRIIQLQELPPGSELGIGYGAPVRVDRTTRTAVVPIGFWDGLEHAPPHAEMLVHGRRVKVLGRRSAQHSVIDVTEIPGARVGSEAVVLGRQGGEEITIDELAGPAQAVPIELYLRLVRLLPHLPSAADT